MTGITRIGPALWLLGACVVSAVLGSALLWLPVAEAAQGAETAGEATRAVTPEVVRWGLIAAAAATGISSLAAGYAVAAVGSAGMGTLAERPDMLGRVLVLVGLAEGIAIYGLIVSILILNRLG